MIQGPEFRLLLIREADRLMRFVSDRLPPDVRRTVAPEDVLQEVWIAAHASLAEFVEDSPDALGRWLTRITESKLVDAIRHSRRLKRGGGEQFECENRNRSTSYLELFARVSSHGRTPSSVEASNEMVHAVQVAIAELPEDYRAAVTMHHIEGRTRTEIATALGKTPAAVNSLLFRGLSKLREPLAAIGVQSGDGIR